ncbi:MAG: hypothetical protein IJ249_05855 [Paludibacteraceae bacterium]|nr:hypothetical protein [Paludibacteraceae bacterium]
MEEVIKYFESLESRIAAQEALREGLEERISALEAELASLEAEIDELKSRPAPEPQVVEKIVEKIVEKPVEVIKEVVVEKPEEPEIPESPEEPEMPVVPEVPESPEPVAAPAKEETATPKAAVYGKAVSDIRQAISLGDRFLYQRELFAQNAELMQRTLTEINELGSFDEAMSYIGSHFQWDTESNSYQQFLVALHRRFG